MDSLLFVTLLVSVFTTGYAFHAAVANTEVTPPYYCIVFDGNVTGSVEYETHDNKTASFPFRLDEATLNYSGSCLSVEQNKSVEALTVDFLPEKAAATVGQWKLRIQFENDAQNTFRVASLGLFAFLPDSLNSTDTTVKYVLDKQEDLWAVTDKDGYTCSSSPFSLVQSAGHQLQQKPLHAYINFEQVKVLAFAQLAKPEFPQEQIFEQCIQDTKTSDVVPIVVGACLAGLVVMVLVAYLIGRARSRRQGYASV